MKKNHKKGIVTLSALFSIVLSLIASMGTLRTQVNNLSGDHIVGSGGVTVNSGSATVAAGPFGSIQSNQGGDFYGDANLNYIPATQTLLVGTAVDNFSGSGLEVVQDFGNNFGQLVLQNTDSGNRASADLIVGGNLMTNSTYYGDFGCNSSTNSDPTYTDIAARDCYTYSSDSNLDIGTASTTGPANINFFAGGTSGNSTQIARLNSTGLSISNDGIPWFNATQALDVKGFITTDQYSGYMQAGNLVLYASSTAQNILVGQGAGAALASSTDSKNTVVGFNALNISTSTQETVAIGENAMQNYIGSAISNDTAVGYNSMNAVTLGKNNTAVGIFSLTGDITGNGNTVMGQSALANNTTGGNNVSIGVNSGLNNSDATNTVNIGTNAGRGLGGMFNNQNSTAVGFDAGENFATSSNDNTLIGFQAGFNITTGTQNTFLGDWLTAPTLTTGSQNINIGYNTFLPSTTANGQMDIGNILYGVNNTGTLGSVSTGNIGVGTTTPSGKFAISQNNPTIPFLLIASSTTAGATSTVFSIDQNGSPWFAGNLPTATCASTCTLGANSSDVSGTIFLSGVQTSVTLTFSSTKAFAPNCVSSDNVTSGNYDASSTPSAVVFSTAVSLGTASITYFCPL